MCGRAIMTACVQVVWTCACFSWLAFVAVGGAYANEPSFALVRASTCCATSSAAPAHGVSVLSCLRLLGHRGTRNRVVRVLRARTIILVTAVDIQRGQAVVYRLLLSSGTTAESPAARVPSSSFGVLLLLVAVLADGLIRSVGSYGTTRRF